MHFKPRSKNFWRPDNWPNANGRAYKSPHATARSGRLDGTYDFVLYQSFDDALGQLIRLFSKGSQVDFGIFGHLIGCIETGEVLDLAGFRFGEALSV
jgi:hypothetical protein